MSVTPDTFLASFPGLAKGLTSDQRNLLDALWDCLCATGASFSKRNLPRVLGKRPMCDVVSGLAPGLYFEQSEAGEKRYSLTLMGALSSSSAPVLIALIVRLLDLVKSLYESDPNVEKIDSDFISNALGLTASESSQLVAAIRIINLPGMPFYFSGQLADGGTWFLTITDDVVELFHAQTSLEYFEHKLMTASRPDPSQDGWLSAVCGHPIDFWATTFGTSSTIAGYRDADFVAPARLEALRKIEDAEFDCTRLICLCEELNACAAGRHAHAVILLTRSVLDHIPPVFGFKTFAEVSSNYGGGGKSFKESAQRLEQQARKVADRLLHQSIRRNEVAPEMKEVVYSQELETVLVEFCRLLKPRRKTKDVKAG